MNEAVSSGSISVGVDRSGENLIERFSDVRKFSMQIAQPLSVEDCGIQSMEDASPTRWHLAHTTWFFETFLLKQCSDYQPLDSRFEYLFNSYYNTVGKQFPRGKRGMISRPGMEETIQYRCHVDEEMMQRFHGKTLSDEQKNVLRIGINHEQQHQELMLTDLKHALSCNPLDPVYLSSRRENAAAAIELSWKDVDAGIAKIGHEGDEFCFDNEQPRHRVFLESYQIARRCVTNREYLEFMNDGGYERPEFWLSHGWSTVEQLGWTSPLYWSKESAGWSQFTLGGRRPIDPDEPVCHVSYLEADAYARWAGCRLATEAEWEHVVCGDRRNPFASDHSGNWSDELMSARLSIHPQPESQSSESTGLANPMGNLWEWTSSHYSAYPGYRSTEGALGEYNGKFMCNVFVLKGGSCATPSKHTRPTYRNFFSPQSRWQFTGIRLARS